MTTILYSCILELSPTRDVFLETKIEYTGSQELTGDEQTAMMLPALQLQLLKVCCIRFNFYFGIPAHCEMCLMMSLLF